jgi:hypothetical protein
MGAGRETAGDGLLDFLGTGAGIGGGCTAAVIGGGGADPWTVRLFTTVRIPATWATSLPASDRAASLVTEPLSVATPSFTDA